MENPDYNESSEERGMLQESEADVSSKEKSSEFRKWTDKSKSE